MQTPIKAVPVCFGLLQMRLALARLQRASCQGLAFATQRPGVAGGHCRSPMWKVLRAHVVCVASSMLQTQSTPMRRLAPWATAGGPFCAAGWGPRRLPSSGPRRERRKSSFFSATRRALATGGLGATPSAAPPAHTTWCTCGPGPNCWTLPHCGLCWRQRSAAPTWPSVGAATSSWGRPTRTSGSTLTCSSRRCTITRSHLLPSLQTSP
mmetsp:Transcript_49338/g.155122  ORF Transcript_49338/g.155122 Transcript_49338/m.155122 type:complete len:209 (+) Transcript_49338:461-1087(+)